MKDSTCKFQPELATAFVKDVVNITRVSAFKVSAALSWFKNAVYAECQVLRISDPSIFVNFVKLCLSEKLEIRISFTVKLL